MEKAEMKRGPYSVQSTREVYRNPWIRVREDRVIQPSGKDGLFGVIEMKAGSSVLAMTDTGEVYLTREYKYGIDRDSIEVMSGGFERDEEALEAGKRELKEELGLSAKEWIDLGRVDPFTTVVHSPNYMFLALELSEEVQANDADEEVHAVKVPLVRAVEMVMKGEITHSASCVIILKAEKYLAGRRQADE